MSNPYAVTYIPGTESKVSVGIRVDGKCLVVPTGTVLPMRCVISNQTVEPFDLRTRTLEWAPSFRLVLNRDRCEITYGIHGHIRRRAQAIRLSFIVIAILLVWTFFGLCTVIFPMIIGLIAIFQPIDQLKVMRVANGQFWLTGFSQAFLDDCEIQFSNASQTEVIGPADRFV